MSSSRPDSLDRLANRLGEALGLYERIIKVIQTQALNRSLRLSGKTTLDFALEWPDYRTFESLPAMYQDAIRAGEKELALFKTKGPSQ